jgi:hypothetical protein
LELAAQAALVRLSTRDAVQAPNYLQELLPLEPTALLVARHPLAAISASLAVGAAQQMWLHPLVVERLELALPLTSQAPYWRLAAAARATLAVLPLLLSITPCLALAQQAALALSLVGKLEQQRRQVALVSLATAAEAAHHQVCKMLLQATVDQAPLESAALVVMAAAVGVRHQAAQSPLP